MKNKGYNQILKRILLVCIYATIFLILSRTHIHAAVEYIPIESNIELKPGQAKMITLETNEEVEIGWETIQEEKCTMHCVEATEKSGGQDSKLSTNIGASREYRPSNGKIIVEYENVSNQNVIINIRQVKRTCDAEACAFISDNKQTDRWLVYKIDEFKSIETSADQSYSVISGVTISGKEFTVKAVWWTDNSSFLFSCPKIIKRYLDNRTPKEEYSPYILSGTASGYKEIILKNVDTCTPKAPNFGVPEENVYSGDMIPPADEKFDPELFVTRSEFSLDGRKLITKSAFVVLTDELFSGKTNALVIRFFTEFLTEEGKFDVLNKEGNGYDAVMVLFIDKDNKIWQVNLTYVIPGRTAVYTVAWKPEELKRFFSDYLYDGKRLKLKSKGSFNNIDSKKNSSNLTWDVNFDIPVFNKLSSKENK